MQWSLFLLILMGQCFFFTCHLYKYKFIQKNKTWDEAQKYCREKHTDLATVYDMTDMKRLRDSTEKQEAVWIGLRSNPETDNRTWHWSLPGVEFNNSETKWAGGEPDDHQGRTENCVRMDRFKWKDVHCNKCNKFICYNEKQEPNKNFHLITNALCWPEAQNYCREHHTDLVSGLNQLNDPDLKEQIHSYDVWIGLFRDTWRWSDGSHFSFRNWHVELFPDDDSKKCAKCAMTMLNGTGKWNSDDCNIKRSFFCYKDRFVLIEENKTWEDALYYCRENYNDLASITNLKEQRWIQQKAKNASTPFVWLGLRYTCTLEFWFWVSDEVVGYKNWASGVRNDECDMSGGMERGGEHKWSSRPDNNMYNFICSTF
ncbi:macrophage mannose receptor 1-like isoform X5 [Dicentrarchus labrax]|uniref:macrophage mannose receptor 1-like isoform X3 n=1 Tax=Dicentrarchus labrax TaxID=13489 RepID=UPI0021F694A4|nr:macrophage mannose receptor 1-like isoform X3 [Dicentrarchus labrax]XP_051258419.1 macrophage mannose receptor 1-like isoform X3 [Dicentrarchus labrax]XP_051258420.1 macrophage mannose receptor 1-like isoform X4 [Dicentrarchus labrax]XP_051258421.1 macrophage mannose receptor 1-like isoform X5 [Dicentrarchus labrax]